MISHAQFIAALSEYLHPVFVAGFSEEIAALYCDGATVQEVARIIADTVRDVSPIEVI
jgi:hypothetical protein